MTPGIIIAHHAFLVLDQLVHCTIKQTPPNKNKDKSSKGYDACSTSTFVILQFLRSNCWVQLPHSLPSRTVLPGEQQEIMGHPPPPSQSEFLLTHWRRWSNFAKSGRGLTYANKIREAQALSAGSTMKSLPMDWKRWKWSELIASSNLTYCVYHSNNIVFSETNYQYFLY